MLEKFCNSGNLKGIEMSAKLGINVNKAFDMLTNLLVGNLTKEQIIEKYGKKDEEKNKLNKNNKSNKKKFC